MGAAHNDDELARLIMQDIQSAVQETEVKAVEDMKIALRVVVDNYHAHDYEILPYNTLALYDLSRPIPEVVKMFSDANVKIGSITECQGDLESTFIALMGGLHNENEQ